MRYRCGHEHQKIRTETEKKRAKKKKPGQNIIRSATKYKTGGFGRKVEGKKGGIGETNCHANDYFVKRSKKSQKEMLRSRKGPEINGAERRNGKGGQNGGPFLTPAPVGRAGNKVDQKPRKRYSTLNY